MRDGQRVVVVEPKPAAKNNRTRNGMKDEKWKVAGGDFPDGGRVGEAFRKEKWEESCMLLYVIVSI